MAQFRKRPVIIEAVQWHRFGDHPQVSMTTRGGGLCKQCGQWLHLHGRIETLEGRHIVCPGDWIITGVAGEHYPCKDAIFIATYEPVEQEVTE